MKKILMIIACGAFLAGMFSCSSDPAAAPVVSADGETLDKAPSYGDMTIGEEGLVTFDPEFLVCNFKGGNYRIDCKVCHRSYFSSIRLADRSSWIDLLDECVEEGPDYTVFSWCINVSLNDGIDRYGELNFVSESEKLGDKQLVFPIFQELNPTAAIIIRRSPIILNNPLPVYDGNAQEITITFYLNNTITGVGAYWTSSWIDHVRSTPIYYGKEDNIIRMAFSLDQFAYEQDPLAIGVGLKRKGLIRLEYWMNGKKAYQDFGISQRSKLPGKGELM